MLSFLKFFFILEKFLIFNSIQQKILDISLKKLNKELENESQDKNNKFLIESNAAFVKSGMNKKRAI